MTVISISIIASKDQVVSGIPRTVSIVANIASLIFYTLDGSIPTVNSMQYTGPIVLPTGKPAVVLNTFASNGICSSPIITEIYQSQHVTGNVRLPHSATSAQPEENMQSVYPFGEPNANQRSIYESPANAGITVDDPDKPEMATGFDGYGHMTGFTNEPYNFQNYAIRYSTTDKEGRAGKGEGNLPAEVKTEGQNPTPAYGPEETFQAFTGTFDPKAFVIFQDASKENPLDPPNINRMYFSLQNDERARDGNAYFNSGLDAPPVNGTFLKAYFNPRDNTMTYYYFDSWCNRWIISKQPYVQNGTYDGNLSGVWAMGAKRHVIEWVPFARRVLF
jgi:hypothetical protein